MPRIASPSSHTSSGPMPRSRPKFQRFYFDTALSSSPAALPSLKSFAGDGRIVFRTDFPFAPADILASFTAKLDAYDGLTADEHKAITMTMRGLCFCVSPSWMHQKKR
jgi:hypothetical protein